MSLDPASGPDRDEWSSSHRSMVHSQPDHNSSGFTTEMTTAQPITVMQSNIQISSLKFYHFSQRDGNFYHITCEAILQQDTFFFDCCSHDFFYQYPNDSTMYHVVCKLVPCDLIENALNGMDIYLENKESLSLHQMLDLKQCLKKRLFNMIQQSMSEIIQQNDDISYQTYSNHVNRFGNSTYNTYNSAANNLDCQDIHRNNFENTST